MTKLHVHGKIMLSGEYAVLHGGTAVLMPVPNHLVIEDAEEVQPDPISPTVKKALDFPIDELKSFEKTDGMPRIKIDDSQFFSHDSEGRKIKLGLGLSAAEAVAVVALRFEIAGFPWIENIEKVVRYAFKIHNDVQGGMGSGADIAACATGHPIKFRRKNDRLQIEPFDLEHAHEMSPMKLVWTGVAADTRMHVRKFTEWLSGDSDSKRLLGKLIAASDALADAWFVVSQVELFEKIDEFISVIHQISDRANLSIYLPIHYELEKWAKQNGGRAKPTGAGGGDMALLIGDLPVRNPHETIIPLNFI